MKIYHSYFKFWRNFERKQDYCWIAITKTYPIDYVGNVYKTLAPIGNRFDDSLNPYNERKFILEYAAMLNELDRESVIAEIKSFSKKRKDIVLLNWEDLTKFSEGRFAYSWLMQIPFVTVKSYDLQNALKEKALHDEIIGKSFINI